MIPLPDGVHISSDAPCEIRRAIQHFEAQAHGHVDVIAWRAYLAMKCKTLPEYVTHYALIRRGENTGQQLMITATEDNIDVVLQVMADELGIHREDIISWRCK